MSAVADLLVLRLATATHSAMSRRAAVPFDTAFRHRTPPPATIATIHGEQP